MENLIIVLILLAIATRKGGEKCMGCPYAKQCGGKCGGENKL